MTLRAELDEFATALKAKATEKDTPLQESIDAFKALATYYAIREKVKIKSGDDENEENPSTFKDFHRAVTGAPQEVPHGGRAKPTSGRRTNS